VNKEQLIPGDAVGDSWGEPAGDLAWLVNDCGTYDDISFSKVLGKQTVKIMNV